MNAHDQFTAAEKAKREFFAEVQQLTRICLDAGETFAEARAWITRDATVRKLFNQFNELV